MDLFGDLLVEEVTEEGDEVDKRVWVALEVVEHSHLSFNATSIQHANQERQPFLQQVVRRAYSNELQCVHEDLLLSDLGGGE